MDTNTPDYAKRVAEAIALVGISQAQLARDIGISQQAAAHLCNKAKSSTHTFEVASYTGTAVEWIARGEGGRVPFVDFIDLASNLGGGLFEAFLSWKPNVPEDEAIAAKARRALFIGLRETHMQFEGSYPTREIEALRACHTVLTHAGVRAELEKAGTEDFGALMIYGKTALIGGLDLTHINEAVPAYESVLSLKEPDPPRYERADTSLVYIDRVVDLSLSAGNGSPHFEYETVEGSHAFRKEFLDNRKLNPKDLKLFEVDGLSMVPSLNPGDLVMIDTSQTRIKNNRVYAIVQEGELRIKRLRVTTEGRVQFKSDNPSPEFEDEEYTPAQLEGQGVEILGRCVWKGGEL